MQIANLLNEYDKGFWDFKGTKKEGLHKLGKYPATMVAPMQYELLSLLISNNKDFKTLLDPFVGSGTTLVEGCNLGLFDVCGIDINPYAVLLSEVKTHNYNRELLTGLDNRISAKLFDVNFEYSVHDFPNIDKWFREDIKNSLSKIRAIILDEEDTWIRKFLWVCFSEVIYKHSNDRTSTFKLHVKKEKDVAQIKDSCIECFLQKVATNQKFLNINHQTTVHLMSGDSTHLLKNLKDSSIDVICTSPPYGDNGTTVTYGQATILFSKWIDCNDLRCDESLLSGYSAIDSASLGSNSTLEEIPIISSAVNYINLLSETKKRKVEKFIAGYYVILKELSRVLSSGGYVLFTVGNRRVDGLQQPLDEITKEIFIQLGLAEETVFTRNILSKKMPSKVSCIENKGAVKSMNQETVLIFKKG